MISKSRAAFAVLVWVAISVAVTSFVNERRWATDVARLRAEAETNAWEEACMRLKRCRNYPLRLHTAHVPDGTTWTCSDLGEPLCGYESISFVHTNGEVVVNVVLHDPFGNH